MSRNLIVDGAEKTVLIVECNAERAVPWTKPEDFRYVPATPTAGLIGLRGEAFLAAFADGAVRRLDLVLGDTVIRALFSTQGREPIEVAMLDAKPGVQLTIVPPGFLKDAKQELAAGKQKAALQLLLAEAVVRSTPQVMDSVRWSPALNRPVLMVRWGLMIQGQFPAPRPGTPGAQAAQQAREFWAGAVGLPLFEKLEERFGKGTFGEWLKESVTAPAGTGFGPPQVGINVPTESRKGRPGTPGKAPQAPPAPVQPSTQGQFTLLTAAEPSAARREALKEGLDAILVVAVAVKGGKMRDGVFQPVSNCSLKLQDVLKGDVVWTSKTATSGEGPVTDEARQAAGKELLTETLAYVDQAVALKPMPSLTPEKVRERVESITTGQQANPLLSLMEIRYYGYKKLLKPAEVAEAFAKIAGPEDGPRLASGPEDQRKQIVQRWLSE